MWTTGYGQNQKVCAIYAIKTGKHYSSHSLDVKQYNVCKNVCRFCKSLLEYIYPNENFVLNYETVELGMTGTKYNIIVNTVIFEAKYMEKKGIEKKP